MPRNPIVLIHGYSDDGAAFGAWERILEERELRLNREPLPLIGKNEVAWF